MKRIEKIRNPFQDRINALNAKDMNEELKVEKLLYEKRDPIPDDINNQRFPMTDILPPNVLKPEDLSMKDLLDEIQSQTILRNNIPAFVKKEIKSDVTQEMIKQFQFDSSKPVEINGKFYKYKPPGVNIDLKDVPPPFPSEAKYKNDIDALFQQQFIIRDELERKRVLLISTMQRITTDYDRGRTSEQEYLTARREFEEFMKLLDKAVAENEQTMASLGNDYDMYDEYKLEHDTQVNLITKENQKSLASYEDELRSRNTGLEVAQQPGESDADYAQRMIDTAQTTVDPAQVEVQAKSFLYNSMKDLMNELTPVYKSEAILNTIVQAGGYEKLQVIKDSWPAVKKLLIDTFGNVARVENIDNIAQLMYNYTMKPFVRPQPTPVSTTPVSATPKVDTGVLINTNFSTPTTKKPYTPIPSDLFASREQFVMNPKLNLTALFPKQVDKGALISAIQPQPRTRAPRQPLSITPYKSPAQIVPDSPNPLITKYNIPEEVGLEKPASLTQRSKSLEQQYQEAGGKKGVPFSEISNEELSLILQDKGIRPSTFADLGKAKKQNYDLVVQIGELPIRPSGVMPMSSFTHQELKDMLASTGQEYKKGNTEDSKAYNYAVLLSLGAIPPKVKLISRNELEKLTTPEMANYLDKNGITGSRGGLASEKLGRSNARELLLKQYDTYVEKRLSGKGLKSEHLRNIKDRFAIVDGEIQAGNNNPQLMRDARKMLKEMVQQKLVTLYEAQTHMKHLRKINKI
jgi:hypothetical protein